MIEASDIDQILEQNTERNKRFLGFRLQEMEMPDGTMADIGVYDDYSPHTGLGSPLDRVPLRISDRIDKGILITTEMATESRLIRDIIKYGSLTKYAERMRMHDELVFSEFTIERLKYDFEYWAVNCVKIQDKESGRIIPFILRPAQLKLLKELERLRLAGKPIRVILLKARQWGGSTLVQIYMNWIQLFRKDNWSSAIVAEVEDQARNIRSMFTTLADLHPKEVKEIDLVPYEGSSKNRVLKGTNTVIGVGSAEKPNSLRSFNFYMLHLSEVGLWGETAKKSADDLVQSLRGMVNTAPYTMIVMESTAKGTGNFFHREWQAASSGKSGYSPVFIAWWEIELYTKKLDLSPVAFVNSWNEYEQWLWSIGASLESIYWYRTKKHTERMDDYRMMEEFPSTAQEAFQSSGSRVFPLKYVANLRPGIQQPKYIGELSADSDKGKEALSNIIFHNSSKGGRMKVWKLPDEPALPDGKYMDGRYCIGVDIGGTTDKADWSVITVFDRYWMAFGGNAERVATWRGHVDQDLLAWIAARIGKWYNNALVAIESNSLTKHEDTEGDHFFTILDEIVDHYPNIYHRTNPEDIQVGLPRKWGFHTNKQTKSMIVNKMKAAMREQTYTERDEVVIAEFDYYEHKPDGSMGATEGMKDDCAMSTMITNWLSSSFMSLPELHDVPDPIKVKLHKRAKNEAML